MVQLLEDHLRDLGMRDCGFLSFIDVRLKKDGEVKEGAVTFDQYFRARIGASWVDTLNRTDSFLLIMDESQVIYEDFAPDFWARVKSLAAMGGTGGVRIICFAVYGDTVQTTIKSGRGTPFTPNKTLGADFLQLNRAETTLLINDLHVRVNIRFPPQLATLLCSFTGGHVGMTRAALEALYQQFKRLAAVRDVTIAEVIHYFLSSNMLHCIHYGIRSPPKFEHFGAETTRLLKQILREGSVAIKTSGPELEIAIDLMERNVIRWNEDVSGQVCFLNEATHRMAYDALCSSARPVREPSSLHDLLEQALPLIRADFLKENLGTGVNNVLMESVWQMELYRCTTALLQAKSHVSPSVGRIFDSTGQLDFYINGDKQWLVEVTREGSRLGEHIQRFTGDGLYAQMPCKARVVLDFRNSRPSKAVLRNYGDVAWFIVYTSDYMHATLVRKGHPDKAIPFSGPEIDPQQQQQLLASLMGRLLMYEEKEEAQPKKSPHKKSPHKKGGRR